jgi:hypothetical protein
MIVLLAQVPGDEVREATVVDALQQTGSLRVAEMAEVAADPRTQRRRIGASREHVAIVVALQQQCIDAAEAVDDVWRDVPGIREHAEAAAVGGEDELAGLASVVRHGERRDLDVPDAEGARMAREELQARQVAQG